MGATIEGQLSLRTGQLVGTDSDGHALGADRMHVAGSAFLDEGF
jgi:hypothetical protein